ncbi:MAG: putative zinc-binding metallopeptidase [Polyangiales bacterium]
MRAFACNLCGQLLFFENSHCLRCGTAVGLVPELLALTAIEPAPRVSRSSEVQLKRMRRCARASLAQCNWLVAEDDPRDLCASCRLTSAVPHMHADQELRAFAQAEGAKRRLLYQLIDLGLPIRTRQQDPKRGLTFVLALRSEETPVMTGHLDGVITLDLSECDNVHRERLRHAFGEPYRTLLGHFRHEVGHYYWNLLIDGKAPHAPFRALFGDERIDYQEALARNYERGPHTYWADRHVSAYAASHPWEDWAETFAHYLHIRDTLQTSAHFGLRVSPTAHAVPPKGGKLDARAREEVAELDFEQVVSDWLPLTYAFNAVNRSMGKDDLYPFVLAPAVIDKLSFVHDLVRTVRIDACNVATEDDPDVEARESKPPRAASAA